MSDGYALDDAAAAALYAIEAQEREHIGAIYRDGVGFGRTPVVSGGHGGVKGSLTIPTGLRNVAALFHNHPLVEWRQGKPLRGDNVRDSFSADDRMQARKLGVPSYISAGDTVMKFDPSTGRTEEVLAEFPIAELLDRIDKL